MFSFLIFSGLSQKAIIFDAGSSSTRVYLYEFTDPKNATSFSAMIDDKGQPLKLKGKYKLSDVANDTSIMDKIYKELLTDYANLKIPENEQPNVELIIYATAGMRLLPEEDQKRVLDIAFEKAKNNFKYIVKRENFRVIEGYEEALYAWIGVNRLRRAFGSDISTLPIFEFGGASAQIATEVKGKTNNYLGQFTHSVAIGSDEYKVFAHSWLGYGGDQNAITVHREVLKTGTYSPCIIEGANLTLEIDGAKITFFGKPDYQKCYDLYSELVFKKDESKNCQGFPVIFKDEKKNVCVPLPAKFDRIYAQGVMQLSAEYLKINETLNLQDYINKSWWYGNLTYKQAYDYSPGYGFIGMAYLQQIFCINFLQRGFDNFISNVVIRAPANINGVEPQWTLGAILAIYSSAVHIKKLLQWYHWVIISVGAVAIIVITTVIFVICIHKRKPSERNFNTVDGNSLLI